MGPGPTYRWPRTYPSHGVCSRRARAGWWRCPAWVGSITNTSGERREPIGRISGRHRLALEYPMTDTTGPYRAPRFHAEFERVEQRSVLLMRREEWDRMKAQPDE